ncbi:GrpE protein-like protein [Diplonema papillatum]|nr:GrpE protein-like protein [Diplonema papillatum]|eukprot:gene5295-8082_t
MLTTSIRRVMLQAAVSAPGPRAGMFATRRFYAVDAEKEEDVEKPVPDVEEKDAKDKKIEDLTKSLAYSLAEAENARKIALKDVDNARKYALKGFAKELLDVGDNLERALGSVKKEQIEGSPDVAALHKGVEMTNHLLHRVLERHGITIQKVAIGQEFDPQCHEALFNIPATADSKPGTIGNIIKTGYDYKERVLRPTQVGVFSE